MGGTAHGVGASGRCLVFFFGAGTSGTVVGTVDTIAMSPAVVGVGDMRNSWLGLGLGGRRWHKTGERRCHGNSQGGELGGDVNKFGIGQH